MLIISLLHKKTLLSITKPLKIKSFSPFHNLKPYFFSTKTLIPKNHKNPIFSSSQISNLIAENQFLNTYNVTQIENSLKTLHYINPSPDFLKINVSLLKKVLEASKKFGLTSEAFRSFFVSLKFFEFSDKTIFKVLEECPKAVLMNEIHILEKLKFFESFGFEIDEIDRIFGLFPNVLTYGIENKIKPLFKEFSEILKFDENLVKNEILRDPSVLALELGESTRYLEMLSSLKCRVGIKERIYSNGAFRAGLEVKKRVDCLCSYGLIRRDVFKVLFKEPRVVLYEVKDIDRKIEFLVHKMGFNVSWLVEVPEYLGMNFEKQIVARYSVIEYLKSRGGIGDEVSLKGIVKLSRLRFYNLYVKPYPECDKLYGRFAGDVVVKSQHPAGLWKLFVPKNHTSSKEDVKNIKSFMDTIS